MDVTWLLSIIPRTRGIDPWHDGIERITTVLGRETKTRTCHGSIEAINVETTFKPGTELHTHNRSK